MARQCTKRKRPRNFCVVQGKDVAGSSTRIWSYYLDAYDSDCDDISSAKAVLMANLFSYDSDVHSECSIDKKYFDIQKKELSLDNDRLLDHIIYQDVINIVMHADYVSINVLPLNNKCHVDDNLKSEQLIQENDHLFGLLLSQDIVHIFVNSLATLTIYAKIEKDYIDEYSENLMLKAELAKKEHMVKKKFLMKLSLNNQNALEILEFFKINDWQAKLDVKDVSIANLRKHIESLKGKNVVKKDATPNKSKENADILQELVEHTRVLRPLDSDLDSAWPLKENTSISVNTPNPEIKIYRRKTKVAKSVDLSSEPSILGSRPINISEPNKHWGSTFQNLHLLLLLILGTVIFGNDQIAKIMGYGDYQMGNVTIYRVYYVEGLGHNLFSVGQFCDSDLETKSWLWHRRLSHLNFNSITALAKQGLVRGLPKLRFQKDHLCSACALGKSKKHTHKPKAEDSVQEKLYLKPDLSYLHVFGALCYPTNDSEDLGKLKPKADIGIFNGYAPVKKAYRIYNKRTRLIIETIQVDFDVLTAMASEQFSSGPGPQLLTPGTISTGLVPNPFSPTPVVSLVPAAAASRHADQTGTPSSTIIDQDAPSSSTSQTPQETQSPVIPSDVEEHFYDIEVAHLDNDPFFGVPIPEPNSEESSSRDVIPTNVHSINQPSEHLRKWTKDHPLDNVIGNPSRPITT
ncbi:integrase, catalytic region, zinc finger, CCHC-type containing protein [Tanacetum coccineum]